ncbi:Cupin-like domain-containing protein [Pseudoduganella flava]|nr:cupin-like domain-containing protein [Pseudoduganella flava]TWI46490.1 Cupin-like domain-containing protein [Pseudoduganella flava]
MIDERILQHIPGMAAARRVPSIDAADLTEERFRRDYVDRNLPLLIKGAIRHWPACGRWTDKRYLAGKVGENKVNLYRHLNFSNDATMKRSAIPGTMAQALDVLHSDEDAVIFLPFRVDAPNSKFTSLKDDIGGVRFLAKPKKPLFYPRARTFMYRGAGSGWHTHTIDETLMCQIGGAKRVGLLPAKDASYAALKRIFFSERYLDDPNVFDELPAKLRPFVADVEQGDALYIPPSWWHGVQPIDEGVGATLAFCWRSPLHKISDLSYPPVRELWREAYAKPNLGMLVMPLWGLASLGALLGYRLKCLFRRPAGVTTEPPAQA